MDVVVNDSPRIHQMVLNVTKSFGVIVQHLAVEWRKGGIEIASFLFLVQLEVLVRELKVVADNCHGHRKVNLTKDHCEHREHQRPGVLQGRHLPTVTHCCDTIIQP